MMKGSKCKTVEQRQRKARIAGRWGRRTGERGMEEEDLDRLWVWRGKGKDGRGGERMDGYHNKISGVGKERLGMDRG